LPLLSNRFQIISLAALLFAVISAISLLACVPPVSRDALIHHLAVPKLYLQHGGMYEIPQMIFSYYPMNLDLLYLVPLYFKNDIIPKFIHFAFALITAAMIHRYISRRINIQYGFLGALFFISIPVIVRLSSTVYVDLGLICFLFASLLYLFNWIESGFKPKPLIISAIFCGLALGTKYNGLLGLFLLGLSTAFVYSHYNLGLKFNGLKSIGWCALFVGVSLIVFSPWMLRNIVWTDNPVYPLYNHVFNAESVSSANTDPDMEKAQLSMSHVQIRHQIYGESWIEIALIPLRVFFQGKDDDPKSFDGKLNPFLLLLPIFAFFGIRSGSRQEKTEKMMMLAFSILFILYACAQTSIRIRYFSPILPSLTILSMFGLYNIQSAILDRIPRLSERIKNFAVFGIVFVMLGLNATYLANRFNKDLPLAYISGKVTRDEYIQAYRPEYASFQYANNNLNNEAKILGIYVGNRRYYSDIDVEFSIELLQKLAADAYSSWDISEKLYEQGYTHLLVNFSLFNYWVQNYSLHEKQMLKNFFEFNTITEFSKDGYGLLRVKGKTESTA